MAAAGRGAVLLVLLAAVGGAHGNVRVNYNTVDIVEGQRTQVDIALDVETSDRVAVVFASKDPSWVIINPKEFIFEPGAWNRVEKMNISVYDDDIEEGARHIQVECVSITSADPYYENWPTDTFQLDVVVQENDKAELFVRQNGDTTAENGTLEATLEIELSQMPVQDVSVEVTVDPLDAVATPFEFWLTPQAITQTITLKGLDNEIDDGDRNYTVRILLKQDNDANGWDPFNHVVAEYEFRTLDDDMASLILVDREEGKRVITYEARAGEVTPFHVRIGSRPVHPVTLHYSIDEGGREEGALWMESEVINPTDEWWETRQGGVVALDDGPPEGPAYRAYDDDKNYTITVSTESRDPKYNDFVDKLVVTNIDNDGFTQMRFIITATRGEIEDPSSGEPHSAVDLNELRLRSKRGIPIDLSAASARCFLTSSPYDGPCEGVDDCRAANGCGPNRAIDNNMIHEWKTVGKVTLEITFSNPTTVCSHALIWGSGTAYANPYRWELAGRWEDSEEWTVFYAHGRELPATGPRQQTQWFDFCQSVSNALSPISVFVDPPYYGTGAPPTPIPPTDEPPTIAPPSPIPETSAPATSPPSPPGGGEGGGSSGGADGAGGGDNGGNGNNGAADDDGDDSSDDLWTWLTVLVALLILCCSFVLLFFQRQKDRRAQQQREQRASQAHVNSSTQHQQQRGPEYKEVPAVYPGGNGGAMYEEVPVAGIFGPTPQAQQRDPPPSTINGPQDHHHPLRPAGDAAYAGPATPVGAVGGGNEFGSVVGSMQPPIGDSPPPPDALRRHSSLGGFMGGAMGDRRSSVASNPFAAPRRGSSIGPSGFSRARSGSEVSPPPGESPVRYLGSCERASYYMVDRTLRPR